MGNELEVKQKTDNEIVSNLVLNGDLSKMDAGNRVKYYFSLCQSLHLNPLTKPFDLIQLNGKTVMYANNNCAQQLRQNQKISIVDQKTERIGDIILTTVKVQNGEGRTDTGTGAVNVAGVKGDALANAIMKSETKAKRRATLSISSLGMIDEVELDTIPDVKKIEINLDSGVITTPPEPEKKNSAPKPEQKKTTGMKATPDAIKKYFADHHNPEVANFFSGLKAPDKLELCNKCGWDVAEMDVAITQILLSNQPAEVTA